MDQHAKNISPNCGVNPDIQPLPSHNCCSFNGVSCATESPWCNQSPANCTTCNGNWLPPSITKFTNFTINKK
jgi:hypothetical protein